MVDALLSLSLRQRVLIVTAACLLIAGGVYAFRTIPIDAFPDVTPIIVQVVTKAPGFSPEEIERFVTFPLELQLTGAPGLREVRSLSKVGLSMITVVFDDAIDIYLARQVVNQRVQEVQDRLPAGSVSELVPNTTGLGEVYQYFLQGPHDDDPGYLVSETELTERRTIQDWVIRPLLKGLHGIVEVNSQGGLVKQYQVMVDPGLLWKYDLALHDVFGAVARNNTNAGGNILEKHGEKLIVRGIGLIKSIRDIENIVLKQQGGTPVYVRDVAEVQIGHAVRHGAVVLNGKREVVAGIVLMLRGGNAREVVEAIRNKVDDIHEKRLLPDGLRIVPFYDRIELIAAALHTVYKALLEGIVLVVIVLFLFLGDVRSALIVTATLITAPLATFIVMKQLGLTANLMSLGGMTIAIGIMVDGSVVVVENVYRLLSEHHGPIDRKQLVLQAAKEVGRPVVFGILIIIVVFLPVLSLEGIEGKMFHPLAYTIMIALLASLLLSLTLSPVLCSLAMKRGSEGDTFIVRWTKHGYLPLLRWAMGHRLMVLASALALLVASLGLFPFLGGEFIPILNELAISPQTIRYPSISLENSIEIEKEMQQAAMEVPEVRMIASKIGRSELGNDPQEPNASDPVLMLKPMEEWTTARTKKELDDAVRQRIKSRVTGATFLLSQPIQNRMDELLSGVRTEAVVKILGEDLNTLRTVAEEIQRAMETIHGVKDIRVEQLFGQSYLTIDINRDKIARHGINVADVREIITTAIGGDPATWVYEGNRRFNLILRFPTEFRDSVAKIRNILLKTATGAFIPLGDLAIVESREGPALISREELQRRIYIGFNTMGRDIESIVAEAQGKIATQVTIPAGYRLEWGGSFENMQRAMARLKIVVPITIGLIFLLLFSSFNSARYAALIILNLPFALIGGIVALWITGEYLSVPASVGFISLFGVAVLNGIVLVSCILKLREEGEVGPEAIVKACLLRLRPVLMTALVALLGLIPLALSTGIGSEVQRPLAVVVIGGLITSTSLTLLVLPALFPWFEKKTTHMLPPRARKRDGHLEEVRPAEPIAVH